MQLELIVKGFYEGLEKGVIYARRCKECGAIEFPPHYACNSCGYHATEQTTITGNGRLKDFVVPGPMNARENLAEIGDYVFGEVELDEGPSINAVVFGASAERAATLCDELPAPVHAKICDMGGYKTLFFELD